jgi:hypothetical protein
MTRNWFLIVALLALGACSDKDGNRASVTSTLLNGGQGQAPPSTPSESVYVFMGQSNMVGTTPHLKPLLDAEAVECAVGGTMISTWIPGGSNYRACMTKLAGRPIKGVFFFQGEQDATTEPGRTHDWANAFRSIVSALNAPVVFAQLGNVNDPALPYWDHIKTEQASIAMTGVRMIKTDDLDPREGVHFTQDGYKTIAARFSQALN